ncbi:hypothetical protein V865_006539 [Kwoniella europaea PYCC6329]|uniref:BZIP domain-containing protein n=1 Tax=Kwoniella europaea PYCC6329 TaxID=1423913 RepID=A0AAX4KPZ1_9TREE
MDPSLLDDLPEGFDDFNFDHTSTLDTLLHPCGATDRYFVSPTSQADAAFLSGSDLALNRDSSSDDISPLAFDHDFLAYLDNHFNWPDDSYNVAADTILPTLSVTNASPSSTCTMTEPSGKYGNSSLQSTSPSKSNDGVDYSESSELARVKCSLSSAQGSNRRLERNMDRVKELEQTQPTRFKSQEGAKEIRKARGRVNARNARRRKKERLEELEKQVAELTERCESYKNDPSVQSQTRSLRTENDTLKLQLTQMSNNALHLQSELSFANERNQTLESVLSSLPYPRGENSSYMLCQESLKSERRLKMSRYILGRLNTPTIRDLHDQSGRIYPELEEYVRERTREDLSRDALVRLREQQRSKKEE